MQRQDKSKMSDAEFFGAPQRKKSIKPEAAQPEWYLDWFSDGVIHQEFVVWHCAWQAVDWFCATTQWLQGFDGITGLNYAGVIAELGLMVDDQSQQRALFSDIKQLESGALAAIQDQRKQAKKAADNASK